MALIMFWTLFSFLVACKNKEVSKYFWMHDLIFLKNVKINWILQDFLKNFYCNIGGIQVEFKSRWLHPKFEVPNFFPILHTICRFRTRFTWCNLDKKDSIGYLWQHFDSFSEPAEGLKIWEWGQVVTEIIQRCWDV